MCAWTLGRASLLCVVSAAALCRGLFSINASESRLFFSFLSTWSKVQQRQRNDCVTCPATTTTTTTTTVIVDAVNFCATRSTWPTSLAACPCTVLFSPLSFPFSFCWARVHPQRRRRRRSLQTVCWALEFVAARNSSFALAVRGCPPPPPPPPPPPSTPVLLFWWWSRSRSRSSKCKLLCLAGLPLLLTPSGCVCIIAP